tara:strand:+ start:1111 stop:1899 length:789 start_codon:yes stop_codon:yes gene_type:complete
MCYIGDIIERDITRFLLTKQIKKCKKCGIIGKHNKHKGNKDKLQTRCVACDKKSNKEWRKENRDARLAQQKEYREENRDARCAYKKEYDSRPETKAKRNARQRTRYANDPAYRTRVILGVALNKFMNGTKNGQRTFEKIGCSSEELTEYLDRTMSPETRAALEAGEKIEIDHIIPQRAPGIDITNDAHVRAIYHYTNLQLLDKSTNIPKRNNVPDWFDTEIWVAEQHARIEACRGMSPIDTIPMNLEMLANAREFANKFRRK